MPFSACGVFQTADGSPPLATTCQRSPLRAKYTRELSALQKKAPPWPSAYFVSGRAAAEDEPVTSATKMLAMPARSDRNATWRPSGDHTGFDGWRMSISCSMVSRPFASRA